MVQLSKVGDSPTQTVHEVGWHLHKQVTWPAYRRDLAYAHEMGLDVHEWRGEDREGRPMHVVWVVATNGHELSVYEISGRV